ncbi:transposase [Actinoplanes sp. SE50]|uniref:hypothetical protein n=1 Tax=unclassified Actinoplanes TaxID=2626549 RepID=UPI00023ED4C7|nr:MULTISPECIES: hypothetical protein [unclassified Actinoplanes]AEV86757.1 hypothetical protein ACPL_5870 [Actinoplanes sp. SE50/110]ATO85154.1 transposase [Actinoplanes sp. SE50]SLM02565.1 hypothetical protein ACSP50_5815 [Actinoplanes sp. SE50/110]
MGSTYQTLLVAADFDATVDALCDAGVVGVVVPLAEHRVAVLPKESEWDQAPVRSIGEGLSVSLSCPALAMSVFDSDLLCCYVIRDGGIVHTYINDVEMTVEWVPEEDGQFHPMIDGVVHSVDFKIPKGPAGDDPAAFASFAVGVPDLNAIAAALRNEGTSAHVMAEVQHEELLAALGLPSRALTTAYRHCEPAVFPDAIVLELE